MSPVPFLDLVRLHASIREPLNSAFDGIVGAGSFVGGSPVLDFEAAFAEAHLRRACTACGSGTDALALTLRALGLGRGDEVIVPSLTFVATAEAVVHVGAEPVIADVDPETLLLSEQSVDAVRSDRSRAVIPVHLYGHVVSFDSIRRWRSDGMYVVEDAAQAHLATWNDEPLGAASNAACFSFYPGKNLGALGDGGAVVSDDLDLLREVRRLRDHGRSTKYEHESIGWCSRLDGLQAAFLNAKLAFLPAWTEARVELAERYRARLSGASGLRLVPWKPGAVHHLLVVRLPACTRDDVRRRLGQIGIDSGLHYPVPLSLQPSLAPWRRKCDNSEQAAAEVLSLPMDPLMSMEEVDEVCQAVLDVTDARHQGEPPQDV